MHSSHGALETGRVLTVFNFVDQLNANTQTLGKIRKDKVRRGVSESTKACDVRRTPEPSAEHKRIPDR